MIHAKNTKININAPARTWQRFGFHVTQLNVEMVIPWDMMKNPRMKLIQGDNTELQLEKVSIPN